MNIEDWFKTKDYNTGVSLYASLPKCSRHILARLQRGNNPKNRATLKYELNKFRNVSVQVITPSTTSKPTQIVTSLKEQQIISAIQNSNKKVTMSMLPDPYLRKRFVEKNNAFYKYCELKYQLNELAQEEEKTALNIIIEIMRLNTVIDEIWREIDYFLEHHKLLPSANDYTSLTYKEQSKKLQLLYQRRTKRTSTLNNLKKELKTLDVRSEEFKKLKDKVGRKTQELQQIETDIQTLKKLTNE